MRKAALIALAMLLVLLLTGCSVANLIGTILGEGSTSAGESETNSAPQSGTAPTEKEDASVSVPAPTTSPDSSANSFDTDPVSVPASEPAVLEEQESTANRQETFDAVHAVTVETVDGGIRVTFEQLPKTAQDLEALLALYPQSDARHAGAFFLASLVRYVDSVEDGLVMIDLLRGPRPMNDMDKDFLKDRLREKSYLPRAYFEGAAPDNDYTPDTPLTLMVYDDPMRAEEGYLYIQVATTGADSKRRITLREKDGQYYLWEYSNVLTGIRLPASQDPWS